MNSNTSSQELFVHPKGLFYLFFAELWERFSFYGMRALLMLYTVNEIFQTPEIYTIGFGIIAKYAFGAGLIILVCSPFIKRLTS